LDHCAQKYEQQLANARTEAQDALATANLQHEGSLRALSDQSATAADGHKRDLEARVAELESEKTTLVAEIQSQHAEALSTAEESKRMELQQLRDEHQAAVAALQTKLVAEAEAAGEQHEASRRELEATLQSRLDEATHEHESAVAEKDELWKTKLSDLETKHSKALALVIRTSDESTAEKLSKAEDEHRATLDAALEKARADAQAKLAATCQSHEEALQQASEDATKSTDTVLASMEQAHKEALNQAKDEAKASFNRHFAEMERKHQETLASAVAEAEETARKALETAASAHHAELLETRSLLTDQVAELQSTIDQHTEQQRLLEGDLATLHQENRDLVEKFETSDATVRQLRAELTEQEELTTAEIKRLQEEFEALNTHLEAVKREREEAEVLMQRSINEKTQLEKHIALLTKQMSSLSPLAKRPSSSRGLDNIPEASYVQLRNGGDRPVSRGSSRPGTSYSERPEMRKNSSGSPKVSMAAAAAAAAVGRSSFSRPGMSSPRPSTPLQASDNVSQRPSTPRQTSDNYFNQPSTPKQASNTKTARGQPPQSFEEYLHNAQAELSELGSVITANETLFAQKIQEHVGDLQKAKDMLSREYKDKFDALLAERDRKEKETDAKNAAEFVTERNALVASYSNGNGQSNGRTELPKQQAEALKTAEKKLVTQYNDRVAKRKSQIHLRHAEQFQSLTQDYDRRVGEVLNDRARLEGDLSVNPDRFEHDFEELDARSVQLETEKESVYGTPESRRTVSQQQTPAKSQVDTSSRPARRVVTGPPHTPPTGTRGFFPGGRDGPQATAQPRTPGTGRSGKSDGSVSSFPPVPQRSLMRMKSPPDGVHTRRTLSGEVKRSEEVWATPGENAPLDLDQDFGVDAADFEASNAAARLRRYAGSPDLKRSSAESQRSLARVRRTDSNGAPAS
jgi:hypothetical protein